MKKNTHYKPAPERQVPTRQDFLKKVATARAAQRLRTGSLPRTRTEACVSAE
jgi:hypothetical protein